MHGKIGPVDLSKNENNWEGLKSDNSENESLLILCLWLWHNFLTDSSIMTSLSQKYDFHVAIRMLFSKISHMPQPPI